MSTQPEAFSMRGKVTDVLTAANKVLLTAFGTPAGPGFVPQSISEDVDHQQGLFMLTFAWDVKKQADKPVEFGMSTDAADYKRGGVFSATRYAKAFMLAGVKYFIGLRNK